MKPLLALAAGGDLDAEELERVHAHVQDCSPCFRELGRFRAALAPLRALRESQTVPDGLLCDVLEAGRSLMDAPRPSVAVGGRRAITQFAAAAALVFVSVLAGSAFFDRAAPEPARIRKFPFDRGLPPIENIGYPIRHDVFHGGSGLLRPANAHSATYGLPFDERILRTRRSQPAMNAQDSELRDD